jgi:hypothetical protein
MFRTLVAAIALAFALGTGVLAQSVSGGWDLNILGPEGAINATATLKQDGEKVTGQIESPKGKTLNISFAIAGPNGNLDIKVTGEVDGATMKGIIDFGMGMAEFTAKKK